LQIIDEVKRAVARGDLQPGDRLPSQRELAELARVNPNTVQRAFREMEVTGLVETVRGQGTFLRNDPGLVQEVRLEMAQMAVVQFVAEMQRLGLGLAEAIGLVRCMWDGKGQAQSQAQSQIHGQIQSQVPGQLQDQTGADASDTGTRPGDQNR